MSGGSGEAGSSGGIGGLTGTSGGASLARQGRWDGPPAGTTSGLL